MKRVIIAALLFLGCLTAQAQDNTYYAKQFQGLDVGTKVANAMNACLPNTAIPCIIVLDPTLAVWPQGTMPTLCAQCSLADYRSGFPIGGGGGALSLAGVVGLFGGSGGCFLQKTGGCSTPSGTVPALYNEGSAAVAVPGLPGSAQAGNPIAKAITPDALQQPVIPYSDQTSTIASVTDSNAKTTLTKLNAQVLALQTALENAGVMVANPLPSTLAGLTGAGIFVMNPTGATTGGPSVANSLGGSVVLNQTPGSTGNPNFNPGGRAWDQGGWVDTGSCPAGPAITLPSTDLYTKAHCGGIITNNSTQVVGGGSLTAYQYPSYVASSTSALSIYNAGGATVVWRGTPRSLWSSAGVYNSYTAINVANKANEMKIGPGYCAGYNTATTAYVVASFTSLATWGNYSGVMPETQMQTVLVYNPSGPSTCYINDGNGNTLSKTFTFVLGATSTGALTLSGPAKTSSIMVLPGIQLTQQQVAGLYCGFKSSGECNGWEAAANQAPNFTNSPGVQWNVHSFYANDGYLWDCPYAVPLSNGATNIAAPTTAGTGPYLATYAHCHAKVSTTGTTVRFKVRPGYVNAAAPNAQVSISIRVDGVLQQICSPVIGTGPSVCEVQGPGDGAAHVYDANIGAVFGNSVAGVYTPAALYSGFGGVFLESVSTPNPATLSPVAETGTSTVLFTDSIVGSGSQANFSSSTGFSAIQRYATGTTSDGDPNLLVLGMGSLSVAADFNPAGLTSGTVPDANATNYINAYVKGGVVGGTVTNIAHVWDFMGVNDFLHGASLWGTGGNCTGIFAYALRNRLAALKAANNSAVIREFGPLNVNSFTESGTDLCTGDSYTTSSNVTAYEYSAGTWNSTSVPAGTTFSGASSPYVYRIIKADICATTGQCTYYEIGPGAPVTTHGYYFPNMSTTHPTCYVSSTQVCYYTDFTHLLQWGHNVFAWAFNDLLSGTTYPKQFQ